MAETSTTPRPKRLPRRNRTLAELIAAIPPGVAPGFKRALEEMQRDRQQPKLIKE